MSNYELSNLIKLEQNLMLNITIVYPEFSICFKSPVKKVFWIFKSGLTIHLSYMVKLILVYCIEHGPGWWSEEADAGVMLQ